MSDELMTLSPRPASAGSNSLAQSRAFSFILPGAAHAALFVEEPEDMALGAESMIVNGRDRVASAENRRECA
jgi:hypothetical protein